MDDLTKGLKASLLSPGQASRVFTTTPLRAYQARAAAAVLDSCLRGKGLEFLWVFPRQSGKDETIAQLTTDLLLLFQRVEGSVIHVYPTHRQIATGLNRLERRLDGRLAGQWWRKAGPYRLGIRSAQCTFFSGHPQAKAEGATANLLLIVNEVQDCDETIIERRFTPMRASSNATALYVGTVRTTSDYLWRLKTRLERLEGEDTIRRLFLVSPEEVGAENPAYAAFVAQQIRLKGRGHPAVRTELFNEPLETATGLFPPRRLALLEGSHPRQRTPIPGEIYVAAIDVGGQDEGSASPLAELTAMENPNRDYTVCTVARVVKGENSVGPAYEVVDVLVDHGSRHFQQSAGNPSLLERLLAYLRHWNVAGVICDQSGVGQGLTDALIKNYPRQVIGFDFSRNHGKARLGSDLLSLIETGRLRYFRGREEEGSDAWWFFTQCEHCGYELADGVPLERGLRWGVSQAAKITRATGQSALVHDDRLLSAALLAEADRLHRAGTLFFGGSESAVIPRRSSPRDWS